MHGEDNDRLRQQNNTRFKELNIAEDKIRKLDNEHVLMASEIKRLKEVIRE